MFPCPTCGKTLPPNAVACQFCGADVARVPRKRDVSVADDHLRTGSGVSREVAWTLYYVLCSVWLLSAIWSIVSILVIEPMAKDYDGLGIVGIAGLLFAGGQALISIGLLAKVEIARGIVNVIAFLNLLFALFGILGGLMGTLIFGGLGVLMLIMSIIEVAVNAGIIWIIGETDRQAMQ